MTFRMQNYSNKGSSASNLLDWDTVTSAYSGDTAKAANSVFDKRRIDFIKHGRFLVLCSSLSSFKFIYTDFFFRENGSSLIFSLHIFYLKLVINDVRISSYRIASIDNIIITLVHVLTTFFSWRSLFLLLINLLHD